VSGAVPAVDPAAMRAAAAALRARADALAGLADGLEYEVGAMTYEGPAAVRFRSGMVERRRRVLDVFTSLNDAADQLLRGAYAVEEQAATRPFGNG